MSSTAVSSEIKYSTKPIILSLKMLSSWGWGPQTNHPVIINVIRATVVNVVKTNKKKKSGPLTLTGEVRNKFTEDMTLDLGHEQ